MSEAAVCERQDRCPLVLEALHRKVTAEADMRLAKMAARDIEERFAVKRTLFNEFYRLAVHCRKAQKIYFAERTQAALVASKAAERDLDAHIAMLSRTSARNAEAQAELNFAEVTGMPSGSGVANG